MKHLKRREIFVLLNKLCFENRISRLPPERVADTLVCTNSSELSSPEVERGILDSQDQKSLDTLKELLRIISTQKLLYICYRCLINSYIKSVSTSFEICSWFLFISAHSVRTFYVSFTRLTSR